jgi:hypothetical protein
VRGAIAASSWCCCRPSSRASPWRRPPPRHGSSSRTAPRPHGPWSSSSPLRHTTHGDYGARRADIRSDCPPPGYPVGSKITTGISRAVFVWYSS